MDVQTFELYQACENKESKGQASLSESRAIFYLDHRSQYSRVLVWHLVGYASEIPLYCFSLPACINDWSKIHDNMRRVSCPLCCTNTNLPNDSIDDLPKNFAILDVIVGAKKKHSSFSSMSHFNSEAVIEDRFCDAGCAEEGDVLTPAKVYCFNCCMFMCNKCNDTLHCKGSALESHEIKTVAELQRHFFHQSPVRDSVFSTMRSNSDGSLCYCKIHREPLKIYCQTDNTAICIYCQLHGKHKGHECVMIEEMASMKREALHNLKEELKVKQGQCVVGFNLCKKVEEDLHETAVSIKAELDIHFKMLHSTLDARKNELLADLTEQVERKGAILKAQTRLAYNKLAAASLACKMYTYIAVRMLTGNLP